MLPNQYLSVGLIIAYMGQYLQYWFCFFILSFSSQCVQGQSSIVLTDSLLSACQSKESTQYIVCLNKLAQTYTDRKSQIKILLKKGEYYSLSTRYDSVIHISEKGLELVKEEDYAYKAGFYNLLAIGHSNNGDFERAIDNYMKAAQFSETSGDSISSGIIKTNVANIYLKMRDYDNAQKLILNAYKIFLNKPDSDRVAMSLGMLAFTNLYLNDTIQALLNAKKAFSIGRKVSNVNSQVRALGVLAGVYKERRVYDSAAYYYELTKQISDKYSLVYHQNMANVGLMKVYYKLGRIDEAKSIAAQLKEVIEKKGTITQKQKFYRSYADILKANGDNTTAYYYLDRAYDLIDSIASERNNKIVNEIRTKYETEKKDKEIAEKELVLQQQANKLYNRNLFLIVLALVAVVLLLIVILVRTGSKNKLAQLEKEKALAVLKAQVDGEEKERKRIARELHDGIANQLATIKLSIEQLLVDNNTKYKDRLGKLINITNNTHKETRRISHNLYPAALLSSGLIEAISAYIHELSTNDLKVSLHTTNNSKVQINKDKKLLVFRLVQEILGNAIRHAHADEIVVDIVISIETLSITIEDDGKGIPDEVLNESKTLFSIKENVLMLGGIVDVDTQEGQGTTVLISIPNKL